MSEMYRAANLEDEAITRSERWIEEQVQSLGSTAAHNEFFTMSIEEATRYGELADTALQAITSIAALPM